MFIFWKKDHSVARNKGKPDLLLVRAVLRSCTRDDGMTRQT